MPNRQPHPCGYPRCPALVPAGQRFCPVHGGELRSEHRSYRDRRTDVAEQAFYRSGRWKRLRAWKLARDPLCEECPSQGRVTVATVVDHIKPIKAGGAAMDPVNLQSLCRACHNRKTGAEAASRAARRG